MKKTFFCLTFFLILVSLYSQSNHSEITYGIPEELTGIWEGNDRYIIFSDNSEAVISLKVFYGWYTDRTAEGPSFASFTRDSNDATAKIPQAIIIGYKSIAPSAWELVVKYPNIKENRIIPVAVIDGKLYLDFMIKVLENETKSTNNSSITTNISNSSDSYENQNTESLKGFWHGIGQVSGIKVSEPITNTKLQSMYITENAVYYLNYWKTDMPFSNEQAAFSDTDKTYYVLKHIQSAGNCYTCTTGRSTIIRNVQKGYKIEKNYTLSSDGMVLAFNSPYLSRISEDSSEDTFIQIVQKNNSRRAPDPNPPFPPSNLDYHLTEIHYLEKNNEQVKEVRQRQQEFYEKYGSTYIK